MRRGAIARFAIAGFASVGVVAGHSVGYLIAVPDDARRARLLHATGHAGWRTLVVAALIAAACSSAVIASRAFRSGSPSVPAPARLWGRLALLQSILFASLEQIERIVAHQGLAWPSLRLLAIGLVVQIAVAAVAALVIGWIVRVALFIARHFRTRRPVLRIARLAMADQCAALRPATLRGAGGLRGPPHLFDC